MFVACVFIVLSAKLLPEIPLEMNHGCFL